MDDGHYRIVFTTTSGTLGEGACLIRAGQFVGADFLHHYHGHISGPHDALEVVMHCERHSPDIVSVMNMPLKFDLRWKGRETRNGFVVDTPLPGNEVLSASCTLLRG